MWGMSKQPGSKKAERLRNMTLHNPTNMPVMDDSMEARKSCKHLKLSVVRTTLVKIGFASAATEMQDKAATT